MIAFVCRTTVCEGDVSVIFEEHTRLYSVGVAGYNDTMLGTAAFVWRFSRSVPRRRSVISTVGQPIPASEDSGHPRKYPEPR